MAGIVFIEPFYGGSHKLLLDIVTKGIDFNPINGYELYTLPAKKWHWRARTSALYFSQVLPDKHNYQILFASSVLNLAELLALRPDLCGLKNILYFHENQLVYPVRKQQERDFQYGYNQILSWYYCLHSAKIYSDMLNFCSLVADVILFNSEFNKRSFLNSIKTFFKLQPDHRPKDLQMKIEPKCQVLYFPVPNYRLPEASLYGDVLHIVWAHRWEHDKNPDSFFRVLNILIEHGCNFQLSVLGENYSESPAIFHEAKEKMEKSNCCQILNWGFASLDKYQEILSTAHVAISTAVHEFYGVSMIEAATLGCYPLCPNRLSYPEIFPEECLYDTDNQLAKKLKYFCRNPAATRRLKLDLEKFKWEKLKWHYEKQFIEIKL